ncbi:putative signal-transduction protein containing cAMP-binding and CBS domains [Archaeoglobus sulfaticallidus PM70-1]|uniref:Putative signal-transduction protein containing cAMP-binding and CBS domains n=1 Tax=Archaeoglobus sulfaticallidus PM70-1 TaxID=387631 RepID=N0BMI2_9EURY|nr:DUF294 nucleotidyltransferase-like domain-containing protein [Archaeoglobus sulfaticallidus]AGK61841.1 putative signal-transduction protein containing cAMP-binding and CBS domains [Archaeoglobus sulfaticallidus PM70-1]
MAAPPKEFLRKIKPFSFLSEKELDYLVANLDVEAYEKGEVVFKKGKHSKYVYVVFQGSVGLYDDDTLIDVVTRGEIFGIISAITGNPLSLTAIAMEDLICYEIKKDAFNEIFEKNPKFSAFFTTFINKRFRSFTNLVRETEGTLQEEIYLMSVEKLIRKDPVVCSRDTVVEDAAKTMINNRVGSIVVVENGKPVGVLTDSDLKKVLVYGDKKDPVERHMVSPAIYIDSEKPVFEAYLTLLNKGINHLIVVNKDSKAIGVITSKDILSQLEPASSLISLYRGIQKASSIEELKSYLSGVRKAVAALALKGFHFYELSRMITSVYDSAVHRVLVMTEKEFDLPDYVWIHMGSSGRKEQIIATDQDNMIIYDGDKKEVLEFAKRVNDRLDEIGIPKCTANYMASNPKWNLTIDEWKDNFKRWFNALTGENIRYLSVFLDLRPIHGDTSLYTELLEFIKDNITSQAIRFLALDATTIEPPIGIFGIKGLDKGLDIKKFGIYPIANGVRVLALENGIVKITNTKERIERLSEISAIGDRKDDLLEAYEFLQELRLRHQSISFSAGFEGDNIIKIDEIDKIESFVLREALKIVSSFQKFIKGRYKVYGL